MRAVLVWSIWSDRRVPPFCQFLDRRDIDAAVVEVVFDRGHVAGKKTAVSADRIATEGNGASFRHVLTDELEGGFFGHGCADGAHLDQLEQTRLGVHVHHHRLHRCQELVWLMDDEAGAFFDDVQIVIRDESGNFYDDITLRVEPRHFEIHPHQHAQQSTRNLVR